MSRCKHREARQSRSSRADGRGRCPGAGRQQAHDLMPGRRSTAVWKCARKRRTIHAEMRILEAVAMPILEDQFKFKLHRARSALLIERTCSAKALVEHLGGLSEECVG